MKEHSKEESISRLRLVRLIRGRTQLAVSQETRISPSRLSILERQLAEPTRKERKALAKLLAVEVEELFEAGPPVLAEPELPTKKEKAEAERQKEEAAKKEGRT